MSTHYLLITTHLPGFFLGGGADAEGTLPCSLCIMPCPDEALDIVGCSWVQLCQEILEGLSGGGLPTAHAYHPAQHVVVFIILTGLCATMSSGAASASIAQRQPSHVTGSKPEARSKFQRGPDKQQRGLLQVRRDIHMHNA